MSLKVKSIDGTIIYSIMYIAIAYSSFYYSSDYQLNRWPLLIVAIIPQAIFFTFGVLKIIFLDSYSKKEWILFFIGAVISISSMLVTKYHVMGLFMFLTVFAAKNIDFDRFLKYFTLFVFPLFLITFMLSVTGIIPNRSYDGRLSFGINYCTDFAAYVFYFFLVYSCLIKKHHLIYLLIGLSLSFFVMKYSRARLDSALILICTLLFLIKDYYEKFFHIKLVKRAILLSPIILCILAFSIALLYYFDISFIKKINDIFSDRFRLSNIAFDILPISFIGSPFEMNGRGLNFTLIEEEYFFLDIFYIQVFYRLGICGLLYTLFVLVIGEYKAFKDKNTTMVICFLMLVTTSFVDHHLPELSYNPFFAYSGLAMFDYLNRKIDASDTYKV